MFKKLLVLTLSGNFHHNISTFGDDCIFCNIYLKWNYKIFLQFIKKYLNLLFEFFLDNFVS